MGYSRFEKDLMDKHIKAGNSKRKPRIILVVDKSGEVYFKPVKKELSDAVVCAGIRKKVSEVPKELIENIRLTKLLKRELKWKSQET